MKKILSYADGRNTELIFRKIPKYISKLLALLQKEQKQLKMAVGNKTY